MYLPRATYRLQLFSGFNLENVREIIPYLKDLGISTIYAAPFFRARKGSSHGYDITLPEEINPEIGSIGQLKEIAEELRKLEMGWLQDIVPNHLAYDIQSPWVKDIWERGKDSQYYSYFDIDWEHPFYDQKVIVPFLGAPFDKVLEEGQLTIQYEQGALFIRYYDNKYPLSSGSYVDLLNMINLPVKGLLDDLQQASTLSPREWSNVKKELHEVVSKEIQLNHYYETSETVHNKTRNIGPPTIGSGGQNNLDLMIQRSLKAINENRSLLNEILNEQYFQLTYWKNTQHSINYRRFFTINDLICLRMENREVFDDYHKLIGELSEKDLVQGIRVDHIDGLYDPEEYLQRLRDLVGDDVYLIVEKILEPGEKIPDNWPVEGSSGYDFLAEVNQLYTDPGGIEKLERFYRQIVPHTKEYDDIVYENKLFILHDRMGGELDNLVRLAEQLGLFPGFNNQQLKNALAQFMAAFPVYRIYITQLPVPEEQLKEVEKAGNLALARSPELSGLFDHLVSLFKSPEEPGDNSNTLHFLKRLQQFTGPLMAKGVEDTTFYVFNRLISRNEVGDSPAIAGVSIEEFHRKMETRQKERPLALNATATHDTKRGEDSRMRLNVLSELTEEWQTVVEELVQSTGNFRSTFGGSHFPDINMEYFIYQTLLGAWPTDENINEQFQGRINEYLVKAGREGKVFTSWSEPNEEYEKAVCRFTTQLLMEEEILSRSFKPILRKATRYGMYYSLGQVVLKMAAPGIPDIYQGDELWDLNLVDPDNRRPVDYYLRKKYFEEIRKLEATDNKRLLAHLLETMETGQIKLYVIYKALQVRNKFQGLFAKGRYVSLTTKGEGKNNVIAFARSEEGGNWIIAIVPLRLVSLVNFDQLPIGKEVWKDTIIEIPDGAPAEWFNAFTGKNYTAVNKLKIADVLEDFPVTILTSKEL